MANKVLLDTADIQSMDSASLGPVEQPSTDRVYIVIQSPRVSNQPLEYTRFYRLDSLPGQGQYIVSVASPGGENWESPQITITRE